LECAVVLAVLGGFVVILAVIGLGFYAVRKIGPASLRVRTTLLRMFSFTMEIESSSAARKSSGSAESDRGPANAEVEALSQVAPEAPSGK
jgi:hypothetical protein